MADGDDTEPAPAGKKDEALRLITESLSAADSIAAGLRHLQSLRDNAKLGGQIHLLRGMAGHISDAECCLDAILETVSNQ